MFPSPVQWSLLPACLAFCGFSLHSTVKCERTRWLVLTKVTLQWNTTLPVSYGLQKGINKQCTLIMFDNSFVFVCVCIEKGPLHSNPHCTVIEKSLSGLWNTNPAMKKQPGFQDYSNPPLILLITLALYHLYGMCCGFMWVCMCLSVHMYILSRVGNGAQVEIKVADLEISPFLV